MRFFSFMLRKFFFLTTSLFLVITITFFLMHAVPGDPFSDEKALSEELLLAMKAHYGLDKPVFIQYLHYLKGIFSFDFGPSLKYPGRSVKEVIFSGFPISFFLGIQAISLSLIAGISLGSLAALNKGRWQDKLFLTFSTLGICIPSFLLATFLQYILAIKWPIFPIARWGSFIHTILPTISLAALPTAFIARLIRTNMIGVLQQDYILAAKARGLSSFAILKKHVLRNSFLPVLSYLGPLTASILTGGFAVEKIFGIPGLGQWFVLSIMNRDYTVIMGITIFYGALLMLAVTLMDFLSSLLDPRLKERKQMDLFI